MYNTEEDRTLKDVVLEVVEVLVVLELVEVMEVLQVGSVQQKHSFVSKPKENKPVTRRCWVTGLYLESVIPNTIDEDQTDEVVSQPIKSSHERRGRSVCVGV